MPRDFIETNSIFERRESEGRSYCRAMPKVFSTAKGSIMTDENGQQWIDFLAGCSSLNYGHNDPDMKSALIDHITQDGVAHGLDFHTNAKARFLESLEKLILIPRNMDHRAMFTGPTGANAVEAAMKLARKATGRQNIIAFTNGFHGVTTGALSATANSYHRGGAGMALNGVTRMPYDGYMNGKCDTADFLTAMLEDESSGLDHPAAFILETVQGEGGLNAANSHWLKRIAKLAKKHDILLIVDDIQAGCGRCEGFFSFEKSGIVPDIITMAKSISGFGLPMAMVLVRPAYDLLGPAEHNGTFRGNTHAFVTANVALNKFWGTSKFEQQVFEKSTKLTDQLKDIATLIPGSYIKGRGMMQGIDVIDTVLASKICRNAFENGLMIETSGNRDQVVKVLAPLTTPQSLLDDGISILKKATQSALQ
jgi:diaminobutyrate-2-oxoglutarate transaminase|tara:strand:+ start:640 stop:1908 length:1269 start_codon:yes stop_codon:yes gene_type:complete